MEEREFYLGFSLVKGIGPKTFAFLIEKFKTPQNAWNASAKELVGVGIKSSVVQNFEKFREAFDFKQYLQRLKSNQAHFIALCDKEYPKLLRDSIRPPLVLFVKGNVKSVDFEKTIAVVGTRKMTNYGKDVTRLFATDLSTQGFTIVSGLAIGVDSQASLAAIEARGKTIAVLGSGVDLCFPVSNRVLYSKILDGNGIIVSEFPLGFSPTQGSFPSRNRIIAGLSLGVLVTEGAKDSGSLITADYAFRFKRKVFAVPGPITSSLSVAPLRLIERGAKLVTSADDITKIFNSQFSISNNVQISKKTQMKKYTKEEQKIIRLLQNEALHFDEIVRRLKLNTSLVGSILSILEVKGAVKSADGGYYKLI